MGLRILVWFWLAFVVPPNAAVDADQDTIRTSAGTRFVRLGHTELSSASAKLELSLFVDSAAGRRAFPALVMRSGGSDRSRLNADDHAQTFVIWGHFGKLLALRPNGKLSAAELNQLFGDALRAGFKEAPHDLEHLLEALHPMYENDLSPSDEIVVRSLPSGQLVIERPGETQLILRNPKLVRLWWNAWLGERAPTRRALVEHIEVLGQ